MLPRVDGRPFSKDFKKLCRKIILLKVVVLNLDYIFELLEKLKKKKIPGVDHVVLLCS